MLFYELLLKQHVIASFTGLLYCTSHFQKEKRKGKNTRKKERGNKKKESMEGRKEGQGREYFEYYSV